MSWFVGLPESSTEFVCFYQLSAFYLYCSEGVVAWNLVALTKYSDFTIAALFLFYFNIQSPQKLCSFYELSVYLVKILYSFLLFYLFVQTNTMVDDTTWSSTTSHGVLIKSHRYCTTI